MNPSEIFISIIIISFVAAGMTTMFVDVSDTYRPEDSQVLFNDFEQQFNATADVTSKLDGIQLAITNTQILNPLTWGNVVTLVINAFSLIFDLPGIMHVMLVNAIDIIGWLPSWTANMIELVLIVIVIFAAFAAINKWKS